MAVPANQLINAEVVIHASAAAEGSTARPIQLVTHWRRTAVAVNTTKTAIDTAFQAAVAVPFFAALSITVTQQYNAIRFVNDALDAYSSFTHTVAGAITGDRMAITNAAFLLLRTGYRGSSYKGSKHIGPMSESDSTSGSEDLWNAGCLTRLGTLASALLAGFTDSTGNVWVPSIYSKTLSQDTINPTNIVATDVVQVLVNKRIGTMRGRRVPSVY